MELYGMRILLSDFGEVEDSTSAAFLIENPYLANKLLCLAVIKFLLSLFNSNRQILP